MIHSSNIFLHMKYVRSLFLGCWLSFCVGIGGEDENNDMDGGDDDGNAGASQDIGKSDLCSRLLLVHGTSF